MLENFIILRNLPIDLVEELKRVCDLKTFQSGESLIKEHDNSTDIYFPISGKLDYYKFDEELQKEVKFHELIGGDGVSIGEMSFTDNSSRSCSIYAASDCEVVAYVLSFEKLHQKSKRAKEIIQALKQQVTVQISNHLRDLNKQHVSALRDQVKQLQNQNFYGYVFITMAATLGFTSLVAQVISQYFPHDAKSIIPFTSWGLVTVLMIPAIFIIKTYKVPLTELGLSRQNLIKSLLDGVLFTVSILALVLSVLWIVNFFMPQSTLFANLVSTLQRIDLISSLPYLLSSFLQEIVSRGMTQTAFQKFFSDERGFLAVAITSVFFSISHMPFGLEAVLVTFVGSIVLGLIYLRTRNLAGVTIVHYFFGGILFNAGMT